MTHKYGLVIGKVESDLKKSFKVVTSTKMKYPFAGKGVMKIGAIEKEYSDNLEFHIVESLNWGSSHDKIVNDAKVKWNTENPLRKVPVDLQLIFTYGERRKVWDQVKERKVTLEAASVIKK